VGGILAIDRGAERGRGWGSAEGAKGHLGFNGGRRRKGRKERSGRSFHNCLPRGR
jgi:hypothetical protein